MKWLNVKTDQRCCFVDITRQVQDAVTDLGVNGGAVQVFVTHTTAGVTINECADPAVPTDILGKLAKLVPENEGYLHMEGNSDSHIKTLLTGSSVIVPVDSDGKLVLGTWQAIFFTEYDGPRSRKVVVNPL